MPDSSLMPRIPPSHLPPAFIVRRWPALAELENNPFFLRRFYSKPPRRGWRLQHVYLIALAVCVVGMILNPRLGRLFPLGGIFFLAMLAILIRMAGLSKPAQQFHIFLRQTSLPHLQELWLTTLTSVDVLFGLLAPGVSRRRVRFLSAYMVVLVIAFCGVLAYFKLHAGFTLLDALILGAMGGSAIWNLDAFHISGIHRKIKSLHDLHVGEPGKKLGQMFEYVAGTTIKAIVTVIGLFFLLALLGRLIMAMIPVFEYMEKFNLMAEGLILFVGLVILFVYGLILWVVCARRERYVEDSQRIIARLWEVRVLHEESSRH